MPSKEPWITDYDQRGLMWIPFTYELPGFNREFLAYLLDRIGRLQGYQLAVFKLPQMPDSLREFYRSVPDSAIEQVAAMDRDVPAAREFRFLKLLNTPGTTPEQLREHYPGPGILQFNDYEQYNPIFEEAFPRKRTPAKNACQQFKYDLFAAKGDHQFDIVLKKYPPAGATEEELADLRWHITRDTMPFVMKGSSKAMQVMNHIRPDLKIEVLAENGSGAATAFFRDEFYIFMPESGEIAMVKLTEGLPQFRRIDDLPKLKNPKYWKPIGLFADADGFLICAANRIYEISAKPLRLKKSYEIPMEIAVVGRSGGRIYVESNGALLSMTPGVDDWRKEPNFRLADGKDIRWPRSMISMERDGALRLHLGGATADVDFVDGKVTAEKTYYKGHAMWSSDNILIIQGGQNADRILRITRSPDSTIPLPEILW